MNFASFCDEANYYYDIDHHRDSEKKLEAWICDITEPATIKHPAQK